MVAQGIQLVRMRQRHAHLFGLGFQAVQGAQQACRVALAHLQVILDFAQAAIPAEYPRPHPELVKRRDDARQRQHDGQQDAQHQPHALDQVGQPERQVALQHGHRLVHGPVALLGNRQLAAARVGELTRTVEPACAAVQLLGVLGKQGEQGGVRAVARQQGRGGGHEPDIALGHVGCKVHHAAWQRHGGEERKPPRVSLVLRKIQQLHTRCLQQHLHHQRFGRRGKYQGIEPAREELHRGRRLLQSRQLDRPWLHLVGLQQALNQRGNAAAL